MPKKANPLPDLDPFASVWAQAVRWLLPLEVFIAAFSWFMLKDSGQMSLIDRTFTWPMVSVLLMLQLAFWRNWLSAREVLYASWYLWALYFLANLAVELPSLHQHSGLPPTLLWLILLMMTTMALFPKRYVLPVAIGFFAVSTVLLAFGVFGSGQPSLQSLNWFWQYLFSSVLFIGVLSVSLRLRDRYDQAHWWAHSDMLTGIYNRRHMQKLLEHEWAVGQRYARPFSVLLLDIDHFKTINDQRGHGGGDQVLREVARLLADLLRSSDTIARWGGEEFLVLATHTTASQAQLLAERLRQAVLQQPILGELKVTVSIGVAEFALDHTLETLLEQADAALYQAKHQGRNQTQVFAVPA